MSMALQQGNAVSFQNTMIAEWATVAAIILSLNFQACGFVLVGKKNNKNNLYLLHLQSNRYKYTEENQKQAATHRYNRMHSK